MTVTDPLPGMADTRWRVSAAWMQRAHDCTLAGILERCGAGCCYGPNRWPASSSTEGQAGGPCANLGPNGCTWEPADRPVTCLLYPLRLSRSGTLIVHFVCTMTNGVCRGNHGNGPPLIDAIADQLRELFGDEQYQRVRTDVLAGRDSYFVVPSNVLAAYQREEEQAVELLPPRRRTTSTDDPKQISGG